jgi:hypothetical protein
MDYVHGTSGGSILFIIQIFLFLYYRTLRAAVKNVRLGEADGLKNFHPQKWVPNAMK